MTRTPRYLLATALLTAAVAPAVPAQARVSAAGPAAAAPRALAATATADVYEAGAGDDTSATARAIALPGYGAGVMYEAHTFDVADATMGDEDWISFTVTDAEADAGYVVMIEASADTPGVRPVVEVYAPGAVPAAPTALDGVTDPAAAAASQAAPWLVRGGATLEFRPSSALPGDSATYRARIRPEHEAGEGFGDAAGAYRLRAKFGMTTRLAGPDRHATAARISFERFADGSLDGSAAVVANGLAFPDAMAGATLAGALGCPLLTTDPKALSASTRTELQRLGVDTVYLLGGTGAVTPAVQTALAGMGLSVRRIAGLDRFATAAAIARAADASAAAGTAPLAFVASGRAFPDALSASAVAAHSAAPVLLTEPGRLATATAEALADPALGITDVVIVGGAGAVSAATETSITAIVGAGHVRRLAGANRFATSREVAVWATGDGGANASIGTSATPAALPALDFTRVGVASGAAFPDALAGGVFCGLAGHPLLLTEPWRVSPYIEARLDPFDGVDPGEDYYGAGTEGLTRAYVFGGAGAVWPATLTAFDQLTGARF